MTIARQLHNSKTHAKGNDSNCAICQRHVQISNTIHDLNARHVCDMQGPNGSSMSFYMLPNGQPFIMQNYANDNGFEVYAVITQSMNTQETLDSLRRLAATVTVR